MAGNVTLYEVNTNAVGGMLEGQLLPQPIETLSNIIAITFIGTRRLPSNWMARTFKVRRSMVHQALQWLQANNELYRDIIISPAQLAGLPEDNVPAEVNTLMMKAWPSKSVKATSMTKWVSSCLLTKAIWRSLYGEEDDIEETHNSEGSVATMDVDEDMDEDDGPSQGMSFSE